MITAKAAGKSRRELTVRVTKEQHQRLRTAVFKLNISQCHALTQALEMWLRKVERK